MFNLLKATKEQNSLENLQKKWNSVILLKITFIT